MINCIVSILSDQAKTNNIHPSYPPEPYPLEQTHTHTHTQPVVANGDILLLLIESYRGRRQKADDLVAGFVNYGKVG